VADCRASITDLGPRQAVSMAVAVTARIRQRMQESEVLAPGDAGLFEMPPSRPADRGADSGRALHRDRVARQDQDQMRLF
jgi:hypothetical protein